MADSVYQPESGLSTESSLTSEVIAEREHWLIRMRWLAVAGMFGITSFARWGLGVGLAVTPIFALAALVAGYNGLLWLWLRRRDRLGPGQAPQGDLRIMTNIQISMDLLVLTLVLHFSGGVTNPLAAFMVFHMVISSILLPRRDSYCQAAWASALYIALAVVEVMFPDLHRPMLGYMTAADAPAEITFARPLYVAGECGMLTVTLFLIVYFSTDIAGRLREAYRRLAVANGELAELEKTKSRFLNVAGHQIRTPLAAMYSLLESMQFAAGDLSETHRDLLGRVKHRASGMMELVNEMLVLSSVKEDVRTLVERQPVSVRTVLESVEQLHRESARAGGVELVVDADSDAEVLTWYNALTDIMGNLVSNAVKYTPSGGTVHVTSQRKGHRVAITVSDSGIGIPPADQAKLFGEFFRSHNARQFAGGTGLGLSIVKETVDRLGGRITVCSDTDCGTIVRVELPTV